MWYLFIEGTVKDGHYVVSAFSHQGGRRIEGEITIRDGKYILDDGTEIATNEISFVVRPDQLPIVTGATMLLSGFFRKNPEFSAKKPSPS